MRLRIVVAFLILTTFFQAFQHADVRPDISPGVEERLDSCMSLTFFQLNIWEGLGNIDNGQDVLNDQLLSLMPDVASFCEFPSKGDETVKGASAEYILKQAIDYLFEKTGVRYYKTSMTGSGTRGILTRFPIVEDASPVASSNGSGPQPWFYRTVINFHGQEVAVYSSHSVHYYYACYLSRGYGDGSEPYGWDKLKDGPVTDLEAVVARDVTGNRIQMAIDLTEDVEEQAAKGRVCIYAGDLNQPSHLDWTEETKNIRGHGGLVVPWSVSSYLSANGFHDAYRVVYPDPVKNPGFTWPVLNKDAKKVTSWAPEADERDRIDFVYYYDSERIAVRKAQLVGPDMTIEHGDPVHDPLSKDELIHPANNIWCSDHRGLLITFGISIGD